METRLLFFDGCPHWRTAEEGSPAGLACRLHASEEGLAGAAMIEQPVRALR